MGKPIIKLHTLDEAAEIIGKTKRTVYGYVRDGRIPAVKIGREWKIRDEAIQAYLADEHEEADDLSDMYTVPEVCEMLGITPQTVYGYVKSGRIKSEKHGRERYFKPADIEAFLSGE